MDVLLNKLTVYQEPPGIGTDGATSVLVEEELWNNQKAEKKEQIRNQSVKARHLVGISSSICEISILKSKTQIVFKMTPKQKMYWDNREKKTFNFVFSSDSHIIVKHQLTKK